MKGVQEAPAVPGKERGTKIIHGRPMKEYINKPSEGAPQVPGIALGTLLSQDGLLTSLWGGYYLNCTYEEMKAPKVKEVKFKVRSIF